MPVESEVEVAAYLKQTNKRLYDRLLLNRVITGTITAIGGTAPLRQVKVDTTGDAWIACYVTGYTPQLGDQVDLIWRDADTAYVLTPRARQVLSSTYVPIGAPTTLTADTASVTFSNIPQVCQHLKFFICAQTSNATAVFINCQLNGDGGNNYYGGYGTWDTTFNTPAVQNSAIGVWNVGAVPASASANTGTNEITIFDYTSGSTTASRRVGMTFLTHAVRGGASGNFLTVVGGGTYAPATVTAITSIKVFPATGNFVNGSKFWLYGV